MLYLIFVIFLDFLNKNQVEPMMGILDPIYITDICTRLIDFVLIANGVMIDHTVGLSKFAKRLAPWNFGIILG